MEKELKLYTELTEEEKQQALQINYEKFSWYFDSSSEAEHLLDYVEERMGEMGLETLEYEVDSYDRVRFINRDLMMDFEQVIPSILLSEENEEERNKIEKLKEIYEELLEFTEDSFECEIELYNNEICMSTTTDYRITSQLEPEELKERIEEIKKELENTKEEVKVEVGEIQKSAMNFLKEQEIKMLFGEGLDEIGESGVDFLMECIIEMKTNELLGLKEYINKKVKEVMAQIEKTVECAGSDQRIIDCLKETEDIKFDGEFKVEFL